MNETQIIFWYNLNKSRIIVGLGISVSTPVLGIKEGGGSDGLWVIGVWGRRVMSSAWMGDGVMGVSGSAGMGPPLASAFLILHPGFLNISQLHTIPLSALLVGFAFRCWLPDSVRTYWWLIIFYFRFTFTFSSILIFASIIFHCPTLCFLYYFHLYTYLIL